MPKRKQFFILSIVFLTLSLFAFPEIIRANGSIWHVATSGDDESGNGSSGQPWKTIQGAINKGGVTNGDTIVVHDGTYTENVDVTKSLTIKSENGYSTTTVAGADPNDHVFEITASNVTIGGKDCGLSIYGATGEEQAGIFLDSTATSCTIQGNRCGWDNSYKNCHGIYLYYSNSKTISGNICEWNTSGISLNTSSDNIISGNTVSSNTYGIFLALSERNTISYNTCSSNTRSGIYFTESSKNALIDNTTNSNGTEGIWLYGSSNHNMLAKNSANLNTYYGIYLDNSDYNILTNNSANSNSSNGIHISYSNNNAIYLNNFNNTNNVFSESSTNTWHSPTPIYYGYTGSAYHKNSLGNYYHDYTGNDTDMDGIGNTAYSDTGMTDNHPLMATSDHYSLQAWWLSGDSKMYRDDMTKAVDSVVISGGSSHIWIADQATLADVSFLGTGIWTGQIVFTAPLANTHSFNIEIGYSTDGIDFPKEDGPEVTITSDGNDSVFTYQADANTFTVAEGNYLALRITNNNTTSYSVQTGGAWSYCSAPDESQDYSLPVELTSFTATAGNGTVTLNWATESEIENLGFNIYRSTAENGEFVMLNAELIAGAGSSSEKHEYSYVDHNVKNGITYWYKLEDVDYTGRTELHGPISAAMLSPKEFCLHRNYPNPFNPVTTIAYDLPKDVYVELAVYNMLGEKVTTLVNGDQPAGSYQLEWDGRDSYGRIVPSGMYFIRINAGSYCQTNKMIFIR